MKVLMINGSPRGEANTYLALSEVAKSLEEEGIESEIFNIGVRPVQGCVACYKCVELGRCIFHDELYETICAKMSQCDGLVIGSPTYFAGPAGSLCAILDRLFFSAGHLFAYKPGACAVVARRGGASAAFDRLNKYFTICNMPVVPSQYWNMVYGATPGQAASDAEGLQTMRRLGKNMAWMLKSLAGVPRPEFDEERARTNFIR